MVARCSADDAGLTAMSLPGGVAGHRFCLPSADRDLLARYAPW